MIFRHFVRFSNMIFQHFVRFSNKFAAKVLLFFIYARKIGIFWSLAAEVRLGCALFEGLGIKKATPKGR